MKKVVIFDDVLAARGEVFHIPGLEVAVTTSPGRTESWSNRFELPRLAVHATTSPAELLAEMERG